MPFSLITAKGVLKIMFLGFKRPIEIVVPLCPFQLDGDRDFSKLLKPFVSVSPLLVDFTMG